LKFIRFGRGVGVAKKKWKQDKNGGGFILRRKGHLRYMGRETEREGGDSGDAAAQRQSKEEKTHHRLD